MYNAHFLFPLKYCATLSRSTPTFSLRNWMPLLHQGTRMHRELNFSMTKLGHLQFSHRETNYPACKRHSG